MKVSALLSALALAAGAHDAAVAAPRVILVGDSTMASETGYGDALCKRMRPDVVCFNRAKGGRSSGSYRAEGSWDGVLQLLGDDSNPTYVLLQFGHNDQPGKPGRSTDLVHEYPANLARYVEELKAAHAIPVLVTPLTRREFRQGVLQNDLAPWAAAMRQVAHDEHVNLLELNADSNAAVQAMGETEADSFAMAAPDAAASNAAQKGDHYRGFDRTHLGAKGADYFSRMVAGEWQKAMPQVAHLFTDGGAK
jgi:lysophospholipase L1-like esterase